MKSGEQVRELFKEYGGVIDESLKTILTAQSKLPMYGHMAYFMGFLDENLSPIDSYGGKRFRSSLCLMLADWYGHKNKCIPVATSIELFHNFTLIHDDIFDDDTHRRGRKTVWNVWGEAHAINSGDGQAILAHKVLVDAYIEGVLSNPYIHGFLSEQYLRVLEGQYLDFALTDAKLDNKEITESDYFEMVSRKTADLISAATKGAALVSEISEKETEELFSFGQNLGIAYQICDDTVSIWEKKEATGKRAYGDILEKKKTLPILYACTQLPQTELDELLELYNGTAELTQDDALRVIELLDAVGTYGEMMVRMNKYATNSKNSVDELSINDDKKEILRSIVDTLLPNIKKDM